MPLDPRIWSGTGPLRSTFPACMAGQGGGFLAKGLQAEQRCSVWLREGIMRHRRRLDRTEPPVEEARRAGLDLECFRIDLGVSRDHRGLWGRPRGGAGRPVPSRSAVRRQWFRGVAGRRRVLIQRMAAAALAAGAARPAAGDRPTSSLPWPASARWPRWRSRRYATCWPRAPSCGGWRPNGALLVRVLTGELGGSRREPRPAGVRGAAAW